MRRTLLRAWLRVRYGARERWVPGLGLMVEVRRRRMSQRDADNIRRLHASLRDGGEESIAHLPCTTGRVHEAVPVTLVSGEPTGRWVCPVCLTRVTEDGGAMTDDGRPATCLPLTDQH